MKFDAIVVGSGPGGGIAAYALASQGLQVALVEAGGRLLPGRDYGRDLPPLDLLERRLAQGKNGGFDSAWDYREQDHFTPVGDRADVALDAGKLCLQHTSQASGDLSGGERTLELVAGEKNAHGGMVLARGAPEANADRPDALV